MPHYKHTQIGYLMLVVLVFVICLFAWVHIMALSELASVDSGSNLLVSGVMAFVVLVLASFATLTVSIDESMLKIKFGYGLYSKKFKLSEIASVQPVRNPWYIGWGVRIGLWPYMIIYNVSGFDAVEIVTKNGKTYRIGTDEPHKLETAIKARLSGLSESTDLQKQSNIIS